MAAGCLKHLAGDRVAVQSAGLEPAEINAIALQAIAGAIPTPLTTGLLNQADVVIAWPAATLPESARKTVRDVGRLRPPRDKESRPSDPSATTSRNA